MKKISLVLFMGCLMAVGVFASNGGSKKLVKKAKAKKSQAKFSRQCCTKSFVDPTSGGVISITACAGWFLSNDAAALTRACEKVDDAASEFLQIGN